MVLPPPRSGSGGLPSTTVSLDDPSVALRPSTSLWSRAARSHSIQATFCQPRRSEILRPPCGTLGYLGVGSCDPGTKPTLPSLRRAPDAIPSLTLSLLRRLQHIALAGPRFHLGPCATARVSLLTLTRCVLVLFTLLPVVTPKTGCSVASSRGAPTFTASDPMSSRGCIH